MKINPFEIIKDTRLWLAAISLLVLWQYRASLSDALHALGNWQTAVSYLKRFGTLGPAVLFIIILAQVFIAFIPGHAFVVASGYIYGAQVTILVVATSAILGSETAFWLARKYGRPLIYRLASPTTIERWDKLAGNRGGLFYFFSLVLPFVPNDLMCYVAGLGRVSGRQFLAANVAGRMLATTAVTLVGVYKFHPPIGFWLLVAGCLGILSISWGFYINAFDVFRSKRDFAHACGSWVMNAYRSFFGIQVQVHGLENLPAGPKILAANHPCASDALLLPPIFEERITALAEAGQFDTLFVGWILTHAGHIPVHAGRPLEAFENASRALAQGKTLLVFPEGTLSPECNGCKARSGAVRLSLRHNVPIIPIGIDVAGSDTVNLRWHSRGRGHGGRFQFRGVYSVRIGRAWYPGQKQAGPPKRLEVHEMTRRLMGQIYLLVRETARERGQ